MSCELTLLHIPDDARKHILGRCDFTSIQVLRKVCWDLRNFIDDVKLESSINSTDVRIEYDKIQIHLETFSFPQSIKERFAKNFYIEYRQATDPFGKKTKGCVVRRKLSDREFKDKILLDEDYVDVFLKDFEIFLEHQRCYLEFFTLLITGTEVDRENQLSEIDMDHAPSNVSKQFNSFLKSIEVFRVKHLILLVSQQSDIMDFLPHIEPESLTSIAIWVDPVCENVLDLDQVAELDQWKHAESIEIGNHYVRCPFRNFAHCSDVTVKYVSIDLNDILDLKTIFTENRHLDFFEAEVSGNNLPNRQTLTEYFGEPNGEDNCWFFEIGDPQNVLQLQVGYSVEVQRRNRDKLPWNVRIVK